MPHPSKTIAPGGAAARGEQHPRPPGSLPPAARGALDGESGRQVVGGGRIPEIEGLRGVAIALVVVYHIWLNRVSGGVDVFLMLSGFLITLSLTRSVEERGRVDCAAFYARIVRRIFPPALFVLVGVMVAALLWLPRVRWQETLGDILAAALYLVNWHLANNAVDYLASQNAASPVQHYWSLAIQGQFYLAWPLVITVAAMVATAFGLRPRGAIVALLGAILGVSLAYSVLATAADQAYAYFNTFARMWEFALGGLAALALPHLSLVRPAKVLMGWLGLAALVVCGLVFRSGDEFPGYAALWPTVAAILVIAASGSGSRIGVDRLLRGATLGYLGGLSYALYLWHWPVLVCYLVVTGRTVPSLTGGLLVIGASVALSIGTKWLVEDRLTASRVVGRGSMAGYAVGAAFLALVLLSTMAWAGAMHFQQRRDERAVAEAGPEGYPGAAVLDDPRGAAALPALPYRPSALEAKEDLPVVYETNCHQNQQDAEALSCSFGADAGSTEATIALVGGSHSAHWLPALQESAGENQWRIVSMTKSACLFSSEEQYLGEDSYTACHEWNDNVLAELATLRPDIVLTTSTRVGGQREHTPDGYVEQWRALEEMDIRVAAIRDTPWPMIDVPECVETHGRDAPQCGRDRSEMYPPGAPAVASRDDVPANVTFLDLTDHICAAERCPPVVGNVLVYRDNSHLTATYARTLAPYLEEPLRSLLERAQGGRP